MGVKTRKCRDCSVDITKSHWQCLRCKKCAVERRNKQQRAYWQKNKKPLRERNCEDCGIRITERGPASTRCISCQKPVTAKRNKEWRKIVKVATAIRTKRWYHKNKELAKKRSKEWYRNNEDRAKAVHREWREKNIKRSKMTNKIWRLENKERIYKDKKGCLEKERENLTDSYIKSLLRRRNAGTPITNSMITPELIELKRKEVLLKRILKSKKV